ncbi:phage major capsid protein [Oceanomicrobium pacificus]|uniref:Phage major capsid protein n=1 Tax=Oceanomicrobium pacificus TaxID=2692916 RepID=A0A6B0TZ62_9RHOB|nr:phage major capsid protein [Oceanomicrobium pacificus]MXU66314.1 phage major capsid protein [Oceanomicrobium pacificus]
MTDEAEVTRLPGGGAADLASEIQGFVRDFNAFKNKVKVEMKEREQRAGAQEHAAAGYGRPVLSRGEEDLSAPHQKAFAAYVRSGDDDAMRGLPIEEKALSTAVAADGGYLVDPQTADRINGVLRGAATLRSIAKVVQVEASAYDMLVDVTDIGAGWADETADATETATPQVERISIPLHELSALPKASQRLLDDSAFDVEGWLAERIADRFARAEGAAFLSGTGADQPLGVMSYTAVPDASWSWGNLGYVATGESGDFNPGEPADAIVDLVYALGARYRANAHFVMNSKTAGAVRKMKDADGRFLWSDGLAAGEPARLMGYPVLVAEDMPDIAPDATAIAFGDFNAGYTIAERPDLRILRDPFSAKPNVLFYATKRVGGDVSDFAAIKLLKFATS